MSLPTANGNLRPSMNASNNMLHRQLDRKNSYSSTIPSILTSSPRSSVASFNVSRYASGVTTSTISSAEEPVDASEIDYINQSMEDFGILDTLDYDDVDDNLLDKENVHRDRETLIESLLTSEQAYVESLELVMRLFLTPLRKDTNHSSFSFLGMKKMVCTEREFRWLFGNFEDLVQMHRSILSSLEERLRIWGPTQILSDVFQSWFPQLECYRIYLDNYDIALTTYERLTRYPPFKKFIDNAHKDKSLRGSTLISLIQLPIGCIDRYNELICRLSNNTSNMHPDFAGLQKCKTWIQQFRQSLEKRLLDADNVDQVMMIHQALVNAPITVKAERRLVMQGQLSRVVLNTRSLGEERHYILFTDLLVFVRPKVEGKTTKLHYKGHLSLERARVRSLSKEEAGGIAHCIELISSFSGVDNLNTTFVASPTVHVLYVGSDKERDEWLKQLENVISNLDRIASVKQAQASRRMMQNRAPRSNGSAGSSPSIFSGNDSSSSRGSSHTN
ncbi:FYVE, RhoGEF and PH domain-containing protein 4 [Choanephora cucurbitarum]|uniref:FYVE, RhoGEF and PH domain-containing protein 4 n=1 Tax=Choanephora cucurbitarum TaxID=101091 RepID=A0A1C7N0H4_9FUNG|nr:FYVE, RhoGEF and PH domain-containing protein 4 [Choanephora cucurbitarum]